MLEEEKTAELEKELINVSGGTENEYRYVFKYGDFVYSTFTRDQMLMIREDVETNDSSHKVKCEKTSTHPTRIESLEDLIRYTSCSDLMMMYRENGGKFYR